MSSTAFQKIHRFTQKTECIKTRNTRMIKPKRMYFLCMHHVCNLSTQVPFGITCFFCITYIAFALFFLVNMFVYTSKSVIFYLSIQMQQTHIIAFLTYGLLLDKMPGENCIPVKHT